MERKDSFTSIKNEKKINKVITKLAIIITIFLILLIAFLYNLKILLSKRSEIIAEINKLNSSNSSIISQITDIENKSVMAKNFIQVWENNYIPNQKLLKGIDIQDVDNKIHKLAAENVMTNVVVNLSPVILAGGQFEKKTLKTYTTLIAIKFNAVTDINVFQFLDDLKKNIGYFMTIQEINLERVKKIDEEFLKNLSSGTIVTAITGEVKIRLYGIGEK